MLIQITLPQLRRFILFASVLTMITAFTALFSLIFVMTGGGPGYGTTTLEFFVYQKASGRPTSATARCGRHAVRDHGRRRADPAAAAADAEGLT